MLELLLMMLFNGLAHKSVDYYEGNVIDTVQAPSFELLL